MRPWRERKLKAKRKSLNVLPDPLPVLFVYGKPRECGGCTACCYVHKIHELDKSMFTHCSHECTAGCDIYATKPAECSGYQCAYRSGDLLDDNARPDKTGLLIDFRMLLRANGTPTDEHLVSIWEVWKDASLAQWPMIVGLGNQCKNLALIPYGAPELSPGVASNIRLRSTNSMVGPGLFDRLSGDEAYESYQQLLAMDLNALLEAQKLRRLVNKRTS